MSRKKEKNHLVQSNGYFSEASEHFLTSGRYPGRDWLYDQVVGNLVESDPFQESLLPAHDVSSATLQKQSEVVKTVTQKGEFATKQTDTRYALIRLVIEDADI